VKRLGAVALASLLAIGTAAADLKHVTVGTLAINGQRVRTLACDLDDGSLGGALKVVGTLAQQKAALDACAPGGGAFRVRWRFASGQVTAVDVGAASDKQAATCVASAVKLTQGPGTGQCEAVVLVGKPDRADAAADTLPSAPRK
jgi:hypothetical protein